MKFNPYIRFLQPGQTVMFRRFEKGILVDAEPEVFHVNQPIRVEKDHSATSYDNFIHALRSFQGIVPIKKEEQQQRILESGRFDIIDHDFVDEKRVKKIQLKHKVKTALGLQLRSYSDSEACYYQFDFDYSQKITEEAFNKAPMLMAHTILTALQTAIAEELAEKRKLLNNIDNE